MTPVDTFGVLSPEGAAHRVHAIRKRLPGLSVECRFHDDFGLGVAATPAAPVRAQKSCPGSTRFSFGGNSASKASKASGSRSAQK